MNLDQGGDSETRFAEYVAGLGSVIGHMERTRPLRDYCTGLMLPGERKSVEPMAAGRLQRARRHSTSRCCIL
jgi:SRSO17 transposase